MQGADLVGQFGRPGAQRIDLRLEFDDPPDAGPVHPVVLAELLHLAQQFDIATRIAAATTGGAAGRHQALAVVGPQGLCMHAGQLRRNGDDEQRRIQLEAGRFTGGERHRDIDRDADGSGGRVGEPARRVLARLVTTKPAQP